MAEQSKPSVEATPEQLVYARILEIGMYIGLAMLFVTFALYVFGVMSPFIPLDEISNYWSMNVHDYTEHAKIPTGWGWTSMVGKGDFLNFIPIALLAGVTIICYIAILPVLARSKDWVYFGISVLEVLVLVLAASGILAAGH
jgi:hypothetical protein